MFIVVNPALLHDFTNWIFLENVVIGLSKLVRRFIVEQLEVNQFLDAFML